jgi:uncharacterized protein (TIGR00255 family)
MRSMTGYGKSVYSGEDFILEFEIKSVNSRFLEIRLSVPRELTFLEIEINNKIKGTISRGKISGKLNLVSFEPPELIINRSKLASYLKVMHEIKDITGNQGDIPLDFFLQNEEILYHNEDLSGHSILKEKVFYVIEEGLNEHQRSARNEGESMRNFLVSSSLQMHKSLDIIKGSFPEYKSEISSRMQNAASNLYKGKLCDEDMNRISLEIAFYIEKADVTEEIIRLEHHIKKFSEAILAAEDIGKTLNFLLQEMHREINTIGSKYSHNSIFEEIILIKEEIEKCREMVQNVI